MAELKRRTLHLSSGKQIKLFGNSIAIGKSLQIGEGYTPNIFSCTEQPAENKLSPETPKEQPEGKPSKGKAAGKMVAVVTNPYNLSDADLLELADYNIRLWMDLKDNIRKHGANNPKVFNQDALV